MAVPTQKSSWMAFVCWLIGGLFGLHHFYLRRDRQALIYVTTLGKTLTHTLRVPNTHLCAYVRRWLRHELAE